MVYCKIKMLVYLLKLELVKMLVWFFCLILNPRRIVIDLKSFCFSINLVVLFSVIFLLVLVVTFFWCSSIQSLEGGTLVATCHYGCNLVYVILLSLLLIFLKFQNPHPFILKDVFISLVDFVFESGHLPLSLSPKSLFYSFSNYLVHNFPP